MSTGNTGSSGTTGDALELLAIEERFLAELRAGGAPRLAAYMERYPAHAAALADFAARALSEEEAQSGTGTGMEDDATRGQPLSAGTRGALDAIFGAGELRLYGQTGYEAGAVAETRAGYGGDTDEQTEASERESDVTGGEED
ncbi:MAG: hypothetical protein OJF49_002016 [Ktedonobacterales bacterium]|jgi:hypothetical protein|nr:MAG: hypothetical protein OJF49_002016 [Ktedonobacterales bacterium]